MKHNIFYSKSLGTEYTLEESPRCLDSDPLSHQPTAIDPNFLFPHDACRFFFSAFFLFSPVYFGSWVVPPFFSLWSVAAPPLFSGVTAPFATSATGDKLATSSSTHSHPRSTSASLLCPVLPDV